MQEAKNLTAALGGRWSGSQGMACCPAHNDKTPSLSVGEKDNIVLVKCFAGCSQDAVITALKAKGLWEANSTESPIDRLNRQLAPLAKSDSRHAPITNAPKSEDELSRLETVRRIIGETNEAFAGCYADDYMQSRGLAVTEWPTAIRVHPLAQHPSGAMLPALVATLTLEGEVEPVAVQSIFIDPQTKQKADVSPVKLTHGTMRGAAVKLGELSPDKSLYIVEGIEDALAIWTASCGSAVVWATCGTANMANLKLPSPDLMSRLCIMADGDEAGRKATKALTGALNGHKGLIYHLPEGEDPLSLIAAHKDAEKHPLADVPSEKLFSEVREVETSVEPAVTDTPLQKSGFDIVRIGDLELATEENHFVENLICDTEMSVVFGDSNSGKTFFALDLAFHVALGRQWRGRKVQPGGVLYFALEGTRSFDDRALAFCQENELDAKALPYARIADNIDLAHTDEYAERIVLAVKEAEAEFGCPIRLIVLDTLSRALAGGNENSPEGMGTLITRCDAIRKTSGAHIMLVHHSGKDASRGARGHSNLRGAVDTEIEVSANREAKISVAKVTKQRAMEVGDSFGFALKPIELGETNTGRKIISCIVEPCDAQGFKQDYVPTGNAKLAIDALREAYQNGWRYLPEHYVNPVGVELALWREIFTKRHGGRNLDSVNRGFLRALDKLKINSICGYDSEFGWFIDTMDTPRHETGHESDAE